MKAYKWHKNRPDYARAVEAAVSEPSAPSVTSVTSVTSQSSESSSDSFKTNTQVKGVDESDWVKTDGKHIFHISQNVLRIFDLELNLISETALIKNEKSKYITLSIYLSDNQEITAILDFFW